MVTENPRKSRKLWTIPSSIPTTKVTIDYEEQRPLFAAPPWTVGLSPSLPSLLLRVPERPADARLVWYGTVTTMIMWITACVILFRVEICRRIYVHQYLQNLLKSIRKSTISQALRWTDSTVRPRDSSLCAGEAYLRADKEISLVNSNFHRLGPDMPQQPQHIHIAMIRTL